MSFYLEAPTGSISLHTLERFAEKRLDFLIKIYHARNDRLRLFDVVQDDVNVIDSECLIDGSLKDRISHFFLRLALSKDLDTSEFLITAETVLFEFRFLCMNEDELKTVLKRTANRINAINMEITNTLFEILGIFNLIFNQTMSWSKVVKLYLKGDDSICFHLPFTMVFNLVAKRHVELTNGIAAIPFTKLREIMTEIFKASLKVGIQKARDQHHIRETDSRVRRIMTKLVKHLRQINHPFCQSVNLGRILTHDQVAMEIKQFPLCMFSLYKFLCHRHRLKHHSRIQLTLFLKEIGMPVHEALMFWRQEYSINVENQDGCCHTWKDNEKRYIYNIRHLYGLEGSHINYRAHCCQTLQNQTLTYGDVGGCPFKAYDKVHLLKLLSDMGIPESMHEKVQPLVIREKYSQACNCIRDVLLNPRNSQHPKQECKITEIESICADFYLGANDRHLTENKNAGNCDSGRCMVMTSSTNISQCHCCHGNCSSALKSDELYNSLLSCSRQTQSKHCRDVITGVNKEPDNRSEINISNAHEEEMNLQSSSKEVFNQDSVVRSQSVEDANGYPSLKTSLVHKPSEYYFKLKKLLLLPD